jgi:ABC-type molybdate transport system substrate-binding protein
VSAWRTVGAAAMTTLAFANDATAQTADVASVFAAGSLRAALVEAGREFELARPGTSVPFTFGASGLLKDRLLAGETADVFASANMEHPEALSRAGKAGPTQRFARNAMCALVRPGLEVTSSDLVQRMLEPAIKLGTSTPLADPSGDYAWQMFRRIEQDGVADAFNRLSAKARSS